MEVDGEIGDEDAMQHVEREAHIAQHSHPFGSENLETHPRSVAKTMISNAQGMNATPLL